MLIVAAYYRGAMGIVIVYDINEEKSFNSLFSLANVRRARVASNHFPAGRSKRQADPCRK